MLNKIFAYAAILTFVLQMNAYSDGPMMESTTDTTMPDTGTTTSTTDSTIVSGTQAAYELSNTQQVTAADPALVVLPTAESFTVGNTRVTTSNQSIFDNYRIVPVSYTITYSDATTGAVKASFVYNYTRDEITQYDATGRSVQVFSGTGVLFAFIGLDKKTGALSFSYVQGGQRRDFTYTPS